MYVDARSDSHSFLNLDALWPPSYYCPLNPSHARTTMSKMSSGPQVTHVELAMS